MRLSLLIALFVSMSLSACGGDLSVDQQLIDACYNVRLKEVAQLLRNGANVNARMGVGEGDFRDWWTGTGHAGVEAWTPLIALSEAEAYPPPAAELGAVWTDRERAAALQALVHPDSIQQRQEDAKSILYVLLSNKCDINASDDQGATALFKSVSNQKLDMAETLLQFGADPNTRTGVYIDGPGDVTPLHEATRSRALVELLLKYGANPLAKDSEGRTPIDWLLNDNSRDFDVIVAPGSISFREREPESF